MHYQFFCEVWPPEATDWFIDEYEKLELIQRTSEKYWITGTNKRIYAVSNVHYEVERPLFKIWIFFRSRDKETRSEREKRYIYIEVRGFGMHRIEIETACFVQPIYKFFHSRVARIGEAFPDSKESIAQQRQQHHISETANQNPLSLTPRLLEAASLIARGYKRREIMEIMNLTTDTLGVYRKRIIAAYRKTYQLDDVEIGDLSEILQILHYDKLYFPDEQMQ